MTVMVTGMGRLVKAVVTETLVIIIVTMTVRIMGTSVWRRWWLQGGEEVQIGGVI